MDNRLLVLTSLLSVLSISSGTGLAASLASAESCSGCHKTAPSTMMGFVKDVAVEASLLQIDLATHQEIVKIDRDTVLYGFKSPAEIAGCPDDGISIRFIDENGDKLAAEITGSNFAQTLDPGSFVDRSILTKIITDPDIVTFDTRSESRFAKGHLPGATPLPADSFEKFSHNLPGNPETPVILYGDGGCFNHAVYFAVKTKGYTKVLIYPGGYSDWVAANPVMVQTDWLEKAISEKTPHILIDLRTGDEFIAGHIKGAISLSPTQLAGERGHFPQARDAPIVFYGPGSRKAAALVVSWGYRQVGVLPSSFEAWQAMGYQIDSGSSEKSFRYTHPAKTGTISKSEFRKITGSPGDGILLIDVRDPVEFFTAAIDGSVNIPVAELNRRIAALPKDRKIILYSNQGVRARMAHSLLSSAGIASRYLDAGIDFTADGFLLLDN